MQLLFQLDVYFLKTKNFLSAVVARKSALKVNFRSFIKAENTEHKHNATQTLHSWELN